MPALLRLSTSGCDLDVLPPYLKVNSALTWAVTVTVFGENSSVGAGAASALLAIMTRGIGMIGRTLSKVSTDA